MTPGVRISNQPIANWNAGIWKPCLGRSSTSLWGTHLKFGAIFDAFAQPCRASQQTEHCATPQLRPSQFFHHIFILAEPGRMRWKHPTAPGMMGDYPIASYGAASPARMPVIRETVRLTQHTKRAQPMPQKTQQIREPTPRRPKLKIMAPLYPNPSQLCGNIIVLNGVSFRITKAFRKYPSNIGSFKHICGGPIPCFHPEPQLARLLKKCGQYYLWMGHMWLQPGHKGVIAAFAHVSRVGRAGGENRWIRVGPDFPNVPSAASAERTPHRRRRRERHVFPEHCETEIGPLLPIETEELILSDEGACS